LVDDHVEIFSVTIDRTGVGLPADGFAPQRAFQLDDTALAQQAEGFVQLQISHLRAFLMFREISRAQLMQRLTRDLRVIDGTRQTALVIDPPRGPGLSQHIIHGGDARGENTGECLLDFLRCRVGVAT
jgi:hypothetical protein